MTQAAENRHSAGTPQSALGFCRPLSRARLGGFRDGAQWRDAGIRVIYGRAVRLRSTQEPSGYQAYLVDQRNDNPEQYRAIGWCRGRLCSVIFEIRRDADGEYYHLITAWKATDKEEQDYAENV